MLVKFFTPLSEYCKGVAPEYKTIATTLEVLVPVAKFDCITNTNTCNKYGQWIANFEDI